MSKEAKVTFMVNGVESPINGKVVHRFKSNNELEVTFQVGKTKLDSIKLIFENLNYVNEIKDDNKK